MPGLGATRISELRADFDKVLRVLDTCETVDKGLSVPLEEFQRRHAAVQQALARHGFDAGIVFSDEHYNGDVPYLGGNTNVNIEQVAGVIGPGGFHIVAGLEGGYVAEQLAPRSGSQVHKVELLQLADEKYPIRAERLEEVIEQAAGRRPARIALLTPRQVLPAALLSYLEACYSRECIADAQELYYRIKYEKSDIEMRLIADANKIADGMVRAMLAVLRPGLLETQVAAWGYLVAKELGSEENGWDVMVTANEANRTLIGKALNRPIGHGDWVHVGVAPKRDGLNSCLRRSVVAVEDPSDVTADQRYWMDFVKEAYDVGLEAYVEVARKGCAAREQEQALVNYFARRAPDVSARIGRPVDLVRHKPYTGTHNAGYTECQEFFGAITLDSTEPLGRQIVTMLDVAIRGIGDRWDDVVIPGLDFVVIENTLGKWGARVEELNAVPHIAQSLVGRV